MYLQLAMPGLVTCNIVENQHMNVCISLGTKKTIITIILLMRKLAIEPMSMLSEPGIWQIGIKPSKFCERASYCRYT